MGSSGQGPADTQGSSEDLGFQRCKVCRARSCEVETPCPPQDARRWRVSRGTQETAGPGNPVTGERDSGQRENRGRGPRGDPRLKSARPVGVGDGLKMRLWSRLQLQARLDEGPVPAAGHWLEGEGVGWQETVAVLWRQRKNRRRGGDPPGPCQIERISRTEDLSTQGSPSGNWLNEPTGQLPTSQNLCLDFACSAQCI